MWVLESVTVMQSYELKQQPTPGQKLFHLTAVVKPIAIPGPIGIVYINGQPQFGLGTMNQ